MILDFRHFLHFYHSLFSSSMVLALNLQVRLSVSNHICKIKFTNTKVFNIFPLYIHHHQVFIKSFSPISKNDNCYNLPRSGVTLHVIDCGEGDAKLGSLPVVRHRCVLESLGPQYFVWHVRRPHLGKIS